MTTFKDHFSGLAAQYAAFRPTYPAALFDYLAATCRERNLAWDCACGSGQASPALAERFTRVIATDASASQIAVATPHPGIDYRIAPAEKSGLEARCADLVTVAQALHWLDLSAFYAEALRVLKPGGVLAVWSYGPVRCEQPAVDAMLTSYYVDVVGPYWPPERALVDSGYRTLPFPLPELDPPLFAMQHRWALEPLLGYVRSWSATSRYVTARGEDPVVALGARLREQWGDERGEQVIAWPLVLRLGIAGPSQ
jgi:SAM-dependent methyltransferase